jgi:hypothetical protein
MGTVKLNNDVQTSVRGGLWEVHLVFYWILSGSSKTSQAARETERSLAGETVFAGK